MAGSDDVEGRIEDMLRDGHAVSSTRSRHSGTRLFGLGGELFVDVVALPAGLLVVDLHLERQRERALRKHGIEMIGQHSENILADLLTLREVAALSNTQHHIEKPEIVPS